MNDSWILLIVSASLLIVLAVSSLLIWWTLRLNREMSNSYRQLLESLSFQETERVSLALTASRQLLDKALGLVATNDPLAYQAIQAMTPRSEYDEPEYDPSDEAELARLKSMGRENVGDDLNGEELGYLSDIASISPELFGPDGIAARANT